MADQNSPNGEEILSKICNTTLLLFLSSLINKKHDSLTNCTLASFYLMSSFFCIVEQWRKIRHRCMKTTRNYVAEVIFNLQPISRAWSELKWLWLSSLERLKQQRFETFDIRHRNYSVPNCWRTRRLRHLRRTLRRETRLLSPANQSMEKWLNS